MEISIEEFQAAVSETIERVASGQSLILTGGGVPMAMLSPFPDGAEFERAIESGRVRPARPGARVDQPLRIPSQRSAGELLAEDRGDGNPPVDD